MSGIPAQALDRENVRVRLDDVLGRHGRELFTKRRAAEIIRENLGSQCKLEASLLNAALELQIPQRLCTAHPGELTTTLLSSLAQEMCSSTGFKQELATWAVDVWAEALAVPVVSLDSRFLGFDEIQRQQKGNRHGEHASKSAQERFGRLFRDRTFSPVLSLLLGMICLIILFFTAPYSFIFECMFATVPVALGSFIIGTGMLWAFEFTFAQTGPARHLGSPLIQIFSALSPVVLVPIALALVPTKLRLAEFLVVAYACFVAGISAPFGSGSADRLIRSPREIIFALRYLLTSGWVATITWEILLGAFDHAQSGAIKDSAGRLLGFHDSPFKTDSFGIGTLLQQIISEYTGGSFPSEFYGALLVLASFAFVVDAAFGFAVMFISSSEGEAGHSPAASQSEYREA